jgi:hypothetical protein
MLEIVRDHPSVAQMEFEDTHVISVYNGLRIPTGRRVKRIKGQLFAVGDLDPYNSKLARLLSNDLKMADLENDELMYGVPKCDDGYFSVKAAWQAHNLPRAAMKRIQKEIYTRAEKKMQGALLGAIDTITDLATAPYAEDKIRFEAAKYVYERLAGKTPDVVVHSQDKPWEVVYDRIARGPRPSRTAIEDGNTLEAEIVEDED